MTSFSANILHHHPHLHSLTARYNSSPIRPVYFPRGSMYYSVPARFDPPLPEVQGCQIGPYLPAQSGNPSCSTAADRVARLGREICLNLATLRARYSRFSGMSFITGARGAVYAKYSRRARQWKWRSRR